MMYIILFYYFLLVKLFISTNPAPLHLTYQLISHPSHDMHGHHAHIWDTLVETVCVVWCVVCVIDRTLDR